MDREVIRRAFLTRTHPLLASALSLIAKIPFAYGVVTRFSVRRAFAERHTTLRRPDGRANS